MPGMENTAPERTESRSGFAGSPKVLPVSFSRARRCSSISSVEPIGILAVGGVVDAGGSGHDEAGRHGYPQPGHLRQVGPLAPEQRLHGGVALGEIVDVLAGTHQTSTPFGITRHCRDCGYPLEAVILTKRTPLGSSERSRLPPASGASRQWSRQLAVVLWYRDPKTF